MTEFDPVLVTGAAGFVGACVVRDLLRRGHQVHAVVRPGSNAWRLFDVRREVFAHTVDLADAVAVRGVVDTVRPAAVLHLAAHGAYESQADARVILQTNVLGTWNLLEACGMAGVRVFVNAGSSSEYGFKAEPMRETDVLEPNSTYAVAKAAQTHLCALAACKWPMGVATYRLFSVYGPWEEPTRLVPTLIRRARAGLPLEMVAPGIARDFVCVDDIVSALTDFSVTARPDAGRGEVFNLGTGVQSTLREMVETVIDLLGSRSEVRWGAMAARQWDSDRWSADPEKAGRELGWRPRTALRDGLARMADWMQSIGDDYGTDVAGSLREAG